MFDYSGFIAVLINVIMNICILYNSNKLDVSFDEIAKLPKLIEETMACEKQIKEINKPLTTTRRH